MDRATRSPGRSEEFKWVVPDVFSFAVQYQLKKKEGTFDYQPGHCNRHKGNVILALWCTLHNIWMFIYWNASFSEWGGTLFGVRITIPCSPSTGTSGQPQGTGPRPRQTFSCFNLISPFPIPFAFQYSRETPSSIQHYSTNKIQHQNFSADAQLLA